MAQPRFQEENARVAAHLEKSYTLPGTVSTVVAGVNWTLRVDDGGQTAAFVRVYRSRGRTLDEVEAEIAVLDRVEATTALDVARPRRDLLGRAISRLTWVDGSERMLAVFRPAEGRELAPTTADYGAVGSALAALHRQSALIDVAPARRFDGAVVEAALATVARTSPASADGIAAAIAILDRMQAGQHLGSRSFCHGDLAPLNLRIHGERVTFFDFDDCGTGPLLTDVAAMAFWLETGSQTEPERLWAAFLAGYGQPITAEFGLAVRLLIVHHQLRVLKFLLSDCLLDDALCNRALDDALAMARRAAQGDLKIFTSLPSG